VEKSPALADAHHEQVQTARGYLNAARRARSEPPASEAILARVREAVEAQAYDEALIALNQAVEQYPDDPDLLWALAVLYDEQLGYARKARDVYRQFEWRFPDDPRSAEQRSRREIPEKTQPATSDPTAADESPEPAPDQPAPAEEPGKDADRRAQARKAFAAGLQAQRAGDLDRAIARYGKAVELDPFYAAASYNLGLALKAAGKLQPAADALRAAVSVRAEMTDARFMLAVVLQELGDTDAALREAQEVLAHSPDHARAHLLAGLLHRSRGDPAARGHLEQFVRLAPTDPAAKPVKEWLKKRGIPPDTEPD